MTEINGSDNSDITSRMNSVFNGLSTADTLAAPFRRSLDDLLQVAAESIGSDNVSVLVRDGDDGGLKFIAAISNVKEQLLKIRIPPGKGIAGAVFSSGQPMAISDVAQEGSFWSEADAKTGFKTMTLLATPLRKGGDVIGVLEFVNRAGEPPYPPFTPEEMDVAALYADAIAKLVDAQEMARLVETMFERSVKTSLASGEGEESDTAEWLRTLPAAPEHRDLLQLAVYLQEIVGRGDAEREMCREVLETLARFTKRMTASTGYMGF
ncbi:MAG TPA: GAF domain-containing protein [Pyrinomonadaceae bacterium]